MTHNLILTIYAIFNLGLLVLLNDYLYHLKVNKGLEGYEDNGDI